MSVELPKDAEGREIPLDTKILYNEGGKCFKVNRFTYSVVQTMPGLKWGVMFMDCRYDYCSSFYLAPPEPPDSWEKLEEDLCRAIEDRNEFDSPACGYTNHLDDPCSECRFQGRDIDCLDKMLTDIASRIRKLRGES